MHDLLCQRPALLCLALCLALPCFAVCLALACQRAVKAGQRPGKTISFNFQSKIEWAGRCQRKYDPTAITMDTMNTALPCTLTCFDEEDLLCPASQRSASKAWMLETPYPILPPVDALPTAPEAKQPLDPEEAVQYAASYQAAKQLVEEDPEAPCAISAELEAETEEDPEEPEATHSDYLTYQAAKELVEEEELGAQMLRDKQRFKGYSYGIPEVEYEREWMPFIHGHTIRLRTYRMALESMAPPGVLAPSE